MKCDVCGATSPTHLLNVGSVSIQFGAHRQDSTYPWSLCAVCAEALDSGDFTTVGLYARAYMAAEGNENDKVLASDIACETIRQLRALYQPKLLEQM